MFYFVNVKRDFHLVAVMAILNSPRDLGQERLPLYLIIAFTKACTPFIFGEAICIPFSHSPGNYSSVNKSGQPGHNKCKLYKGSSYYKLKYAADIIFMLGRIRCEQGPFRSILVIIITHFVQELPHLVVHAYIFSG